MNAAERAQVPLGRGDDVDVATGHCCPTCRNDLTPHNVSVWNAGYSVSRRHLRDELLQKRSSVIAKAIYAGGEAPDWLTTADGSPNAASHEFADRVLAALMFADILPPLTPPAS